MRDGRRLIANIGSLLDGSEAERERLVAAGTAVVEGRGGTEDDLVASCAEAEVVTGLGQLPFRSSTSLGNPEVTAQAGARGLREG